MIEQQGTVVGLDEQTVSVRIGASAGCPTCDAGRGCGAGIFGRLLRRSPVEVEIPNTLGARQGEMVTVGIPEQEFLRLLFQLYFLPLVSGLAGAVVGHYLAGLLGAGETMTDAITFIAGACCGGLALWLTRRSPPELRGRMNLRLVRTVSDLPAGLHCTAGSDRAE
jgi:sigma-E factor negative regulatory protein RseC